MQPDETQFAQGFQVVRFHYSWGCWVLRYDRTALWEPSVVLIDRDAPSPLVFRGPGPGELFEGQVVVRPRQAWAWEVTLRWRHRWPLACEPLHGLEAWGVNVDGRPSRVHLTLREMSAWRETPNVWHLFACQGTFSYSVNEDPKAEYFDTH